MAARLVHSQEVAGSIPAPSTKGLPMAKTVEQNTELLPVAQVSAPDNAALLRQIAQLRGQLDSANAEKEALAAQQKKSAEEAERLRERLGEENRSSLPKLPGGAFEVTQGFNIPVHKGKCAIHAKTGDVVVVKGAEIEPLELQRLLAEAGSKAKVFQIDDDVLKEVAELRFVV